MNKISKLDFTGQQIYVGMDIHKKSWSISIFTDTLEHKTFTQPPHIEVLVKYLKRNFPGGTYKSVYEAGYSGFWIHDRLQAHGVQCLIVNPADVCLRRTRSEGIRLTEWTAGNWREVSEAGRLAASMFLPAPRWKTGALSGHGTAW